MIFNIHKATLLQMEQRPNSGPDTPCSVRPDILERELMNRYRMLVLWDGSNLHSVPAVRGFDPLKRPGPNLTTAPRRLAQRNSSIRVSTYASLLLKHTRSTLHPHITIIFLQAGMTKPYAFIVAVDYRAGKLQMIHGYSVAHGSRIASIYAIFDEGTCNMLNKSVL